MSDALLDIALRVIKRQMSHQCLLVVAHLIQRSRSLGKLEFECTLEDVAGGIRVHPATARGFMDELVRHRFIGFSEVSSKVALFLEPGADHEERPFPPILIFSPPKLAELPVEGWSQSVPPLPVKDDEEDTSLEGLPVETVEDDEADVLESAIRRRKRC